MKGAGNGLIHEAYRRRWWNVMIVGIMVFGCGILLGVMGQNCRHRLKQKDAQLLSLNLLFQKEREHTQEIKSKTEEMRIKMYNLRARNTELRSKIAEMQSTIISIGDEQRTIELDLQEKLNEAKLALTEITRRKEAEIEGLKHQLQLCANVESPVKNKPSTVPANVTANENVPTSETTINNVGKLADKENNGYGNDKTIGEEGNKASFTGIREFSAIGNAELWARSGKQENSDDGRIRFGGKIGYLKMAKGKRRNREIAKQTEERGNEDENESNLKSRQFGMYDHKLQENRPPGVKSENSTKPLDTEYTSSKLVAIAKDDMSDNEDHMFNSSL